MARLIKIHEIDQFSEILKIPEQAINDNILQNIRLLDEKNELEPAIRQILYDPNDTPHGPTEIADIITSKIIVRGEKRIGAFVLKGKSFEKVTSRFVTHQFAKLRQLPDLGLSVFLAVGDIQDDAQRDFITLSLDADCDFLIVDALDCARLLLAYDKICPIDGTTYDNLGLCKNGHIQDSGIKLEFSVRENIRFEVPSLRDVSHGGAKRYSAILLVDRHYSKDVLRQIAIDATEEIKRSTYHRNERLQKAWGEIEAQVVWLYFSGELGDIRQTNWICRTEWIDPKLNPRMRPARMKADEVVDQVSITWNKNYQAKKEFNQEHTATKGEILSILEPMIERSLDNFGKVTELHDIRNRNEITEQELISHMQRLCPEINSIYMQGGDLPLPPDDMKDYDQLAQSIFSLLDNICLYYSEKGLKTWPDENRRILVNMGIKDLHREIERLSFEKEKIH